MTENKRFKELQTKLGFKTQKAFADDLGIKRTSLYEIYTSRKNIGVSSHLKNILAIKYGISTTWLETGKGEIFVKEYNNRNDSKVVGNGNIGCNNNNVAGIVNGTMVDNRQYNSESPDVLRAQIDEKDILLREKDERLREKDERLREKDERLREKDERLREKDEYIKELKEVIQEFKTGKKLK